MLTIPTTEPAYLQAGDTIQWQRTLPDYPASEGWALAYRFINQAARIDVVAVAAGDVHQVSISAATSGAYSAGDYTWTAFVTRGADRYTIGQGRTTIRPDLASQSAGFDARTEAQRALDDLRSALLKWLSTSGHVQEYEIAGRRMRFATADEIRARMAIAQREVANETAAQRIAAGQTTGRRVLVRF